MSLNNYERLIQLAEDVFDAKNDPDQLDVNPDVIRHLQQMHPATVSEYNEEEGPVAWVLIIPTTEKLMHQFVESKISERQLYNQTPLHVSYDALYLCSALVLEEYRRQGIVKKLAVQAIQEICKDHPIKALCTWPFTYEGEFSAEKIARLVSLPLFKRKPL